MRSDERRELGEPGEGLDALLKRRALLKFAQELKEAPRADRVYAPREVSQALGRKGRWPGARLEFAAGTRIFTTFSRSLPVDLKT